MPRAHNQHVELHYDTFGSPTVPALLLVNGLSSQCINYRVELCEKFVAEGFFVIRFDNRDVGLSTKFEHHSPADGPAYTVSDMGDDAIAVLDAAGVDRAHVFGMSMGGMIVQTLAIEHPDRLLSMTSVMSSTGDSDVGGSSPEAAALIMQPFPPGKEAFLDRQCLASRTWGSPSAYDEERVRAWAAEAYDRCHLPAGPLRQMAAVRADGSRTERLRSVRVPTLVLHGDRDNLLHFSGGERTAEAIPGARFVLLEGMGHDMVPAYWDRVVQLVSEHAKAVAA